MISSVRIPIPFLEKVINRRERLKAAEDFNGKIDG